MTSYLLDNNYVIYALFTTTVGFMGYLVIKSYFTTTVIETPNSPKTFNFTLDQLKECQDILDNEGDLDDSLKQIFTEEEYNQYKEELLHPENDFSQNLQDIFDNFDIF